MPGRVFIFLDWLRRYLRLQWWTFRRRYYCPADLHVWSYFGAKQRVCRACRAQQQRTNGEWCAVPSGWAPKAAGSGEATDGA